MPTIAIAGGTSPTLGRSITRAIQTTSTLHTPLILTRESPSAPATQHSAAVRQVNYANHKNLVAALQDVHTLIIVIKVTGPQWLDVQIALLDAAREAGVKRFAPSEFGMGQLADERVDVLGVKGRVWEACLVAARESGMEVGRFTCGAFMNYLSIGEEFDGGQGKIEALAGLDDMNIIWDVGRGKAEEPVQDDDSSPKITLTDIWDVGKFVAAACELGPGEWEPEMSMVGETIEIARATALLEEYSGRKMDVTRVKRAEYQARAEAIEGMGRSREEVLAKMTAQFALLDLDEEVGAAIMQPTVNELCPWVKAKNVEEYLARCWRK
ncbi:hypothetical protein Q7P37_008614 [Cladosporium fusiforme]